MHLYPPFAIGSRLTSGKGVLAEIAIASFFGSTTTAPVAAGFTSGLARPRSRTLRPVSRPPLRWGVRRRDQPFPLDIVHAEYRAWELTHPDSYPPCPSSPLILSKISMYRIFEKEHLSIITCGNLLSYKHGSVRSTALTTNAHDDDSNAIR